MGTDVPSLYSYSKQGTGNSKQGTPNREKQNMGAVLVLLILDPGFIPHAYLSPSETKQMVHVWRPRFDTNHAVNVHDVWRMKETKFQVSSDDCSGSLLRMHTDGTLSVFLVAQQIPSRYTIVGTLWSHTVQDKKDVFKDLRDWYAATCNENLIAGDALMDDDKIFWFGSY